MDKADSPRGTPANGFRRVQRKEQEQTPRGPQTVRDAVMERGDSWWTYSGDGFVSRIGLEVAFERLARYREANKMLWCEKGIEPRIYPLDLHGDL